MSSATTVTLVLLVALSLNCFSLAQESSSSPSPPTDRGQECRQLNTRADNAFQAILWIGDRKQSVPRTVADMDNHCKAMKESVRQFRGFGKCVRLFPKQIFAIVATNTRKTIKARCDTEASRREFLKVTECYTDDTKARLDGWMNRMSEFTQFVSTSAITNEMKLPWVCCGYQYTGNATTTDLAKDCAEETLEYTANIMRALFSDVMDLTCGRYNSIATCKDQLPQSFTKYMDLSGGPTSISLWKPLLKITRSLERER